MKNGFKKTQQLGVKGNTEDGASVIANWVEDEQSRERLSRYGASEMSTAELIKAIKELGARDTETSLVKA